MKAAGGRQLLERWSDRALTDFNVGVHNAVGHYQAFYMVRILADSHPYADKSREAAKAEFVNANRNYTDAKRSYNRIK